VVARNIHAVSKRAAKPLVTVNAGGVAEERFREQSCSATSAAPHRREDGSRRRLPRFADGGHPLLDEVGQRSTCRCMRSRRMLLRVLATASSPRRGLEQGQARGPCASRAPRQRAACTGRGFAGRFRARGPALPPEHGGGAASAAARPGSTTFAVRPVSSSSASSTGAARRPALLAGRLEALVRQPWRGNVRELGAREVEARPAASPFRLGEITARDLLLGAPERGPRCSRHAYPGDAERT